MSDLEVEGEEEDESSNSFKSLVYLKKSWLIILLSSTLAHLELEDFFALQLKGLIPPTTTCTEEEEEVGVESVTAFNLKCAVL